MRADAREARWRVVYDLRNMNLYFIETSSGRRVYLKLNALDYSAGHVRIIDIETIRSDYDLSVTSAK